MSFRAVRFQRDILLPALVMAGELAWLALWLRFIFWRADGEPLLSNLALFLTGFAGALLMRVGRAADVSVSGLRLAAITGIVIVPALAITASYGPGWFNQVEPFLANPLVVHPDAILALIVAAVAWWRGLAAGDSALSTASVEARFRVGMIGLAGIALLAPIPMISRFAATVIELVPIHALAFFFFMLSALAICRARTIATTGVGGNKLASRWSSVLLVTLAVMIAIGVVAASLLPHVTPVSETFFGLIGRILHFLGPLLDIIILPLGWLAQILTIALTWLFRLIRRDTLPEPIQDPADAGIERPVIESFDDSMIQAIQWGIAALLAACALWYLARSIRNRKPSPAEGLDEVRDTVWSWREWFEGVKVYLASRFKRTALVHVAAASTREERASEEAKTIRDMYRQFLALCATAGLARRPGQTPTEFLAAAASLTPAGTDAAGTLTDAYILARYGPEPVTGELVAQAKRAWLDLAPALRAATEGGAPATTRRRDSRAT